MSKPCKPGAWGSPDNCLIHEGLPLNKRGHCIEGRPLTAKEKRQMQRDEERRRLYEAAPKHAPEAG